ncbi:MAG: macrolide ABC transporter ATP-binding protein [Deltaproteobacteria bacterium HGW-Deltaproteobacteria-6]|nr:MAG: macrolide ABC transporter ATP-binding protein [Deltaproteobacteria bacterium HGW-Deltaproteobacteria-6]
MLDIVDIRKSYRIGPTEVNVLKGINLSVERGELLAIIGPSGSGKSTLMHMLGLLEKPDSGTYHVEGAKVVYDDDRVLSTLRNRKIGFVFQQYHLLPKLTALENVGVPLTYRGISMNEIRQKSMEFLTKVDIQQRAGHRPSEMSGGQQQRVAIARALVGSPSIILADEPTGALDVKTGEEIMELFQRLNRDEGITIVIITHNPELASQCGRSVKIIDGMIYST